MEIVIIIIGLFCLAVSIMSIVILSVNLTSQKEKMANLEKIMQQSLLSQNDNMDKMRIIVGEKLESTLDTRLNKSYEMINKTLQDVYKSVGEMNALASNVTDLRKVLSNVKTRGVWGEVQLHAMLDQVMSSKQYEVNALINQSTNERVEFAVKLPGKGDDSVYLPIDSKLPLESFSRLVDCSELGDKEGVERCGKELESAIKEQAKKIVSKYILPPKTTDFAIMYLPLESLYAEVVKRNGLCESLQRDRVIVCGPTTLSALLSSLQLGFKTVAIEKRGAELWNLLAAFKVQFSRFTEVIEKSQKKIDEASKTLEEAAKKTKTIQQKLINVEEISSVDADKIMGIDE